MAHKVIPSVWIPLPDGARLAAQIWRPEREDPVPAILEYLPYRRRDVTAARDASVYPAFAEMGFAGVRVDIRGTGESDGVFIDEYSETELSDAEAVLAWIAAQPWCSGKVGMMGISWGGFNALQLAARRPKALKAVISIASTVDRFADDIHYKGGAQMGANLYWATQMLGRAAVPPDAAVVGPSWRETWHERLDALPALIFPWLRHQRRDAYWRHGSICEAFSALEAPAWVIAGWADGYRNTPWKARAGLGDRARALTGPWVHLYPHFAVPGPRLDFVRAAGAWWGRWLRGEDTSVEDWPAHRLWRAEAVRPDAGPGQQAGEWIAIDQDAPTRTKLNLTAQGLSKGSGTGQVHIQTALDCGFDGGAYFTQSAGGDLPGDQRRDDGFSTCFETPPLERALDVIGVPILRLPVALDAPLGSLIARLVDVHPDGVATRITLGVLNLCHRDGSETPHPMTPGQVEEITLALDATAYRLRPGHRLRLALSTAYFPLVLPPPTDVCATIDLAGAVLELPEHAAVPIRVPEVEADARPRFPQITPPSARRWVTRDLATGRCSLHAEEQGAVLRHPEHGLEWQDGHRSTWSITRGDPLSVEGDEVTTALRRRDGIETRVEARGRLRVEADHWVVEAELSAHEDDALVFSRRWHDRIPRDHM